MKRLLLLSLLLISAKGWGATILSIADGNWGDPTIWNGGVVPKNNDKADIFNIVTATYTITVGTSPAAGTWAINLESTGAVHVTSTGHMVVRGDVTYAAGTGNTADAVIVDGGGIWEFDSSQAVNPTAQSYAYYSNGNFGYRKFKVSGSAGNPATVYANASSGMGALKANGQALTGVYELLYASATNMSFDFFLNDSGGPTKWDATYSTFTNCGVIKSESPIGPMNVFKHEHNYHTGTVGGAIFNFNFFEKLTTGTRSIQNNVFDVAMGASNGYTDTTIANNYFADGFEAFFSSWTLFNNNFVRLGTTGGQTLAGNMTNSYVWWDADQGNPHVFNYTDGAPSTQTVSGVIWGQPGDAHTTDSGEFWAQGAPPVISTYTFQYNIFLANGRGYSSLEMTSLLGSSTLATYTNNRNIFDHNTWFGGWEINANTPFAAIDTDESSNMQPGTLLSFRSNLLWNPQNPSFPANFLKVLDVGNLTSNQAVGFGTGPTQDVCAPGNCDYNASYGGSSTATASNVGTYTNQGNGYAGKWSATPGTHDIANQNPQFVDYTRNVETFDAGYYRPYFGMAAAPAWSSGGSYVIGNVVSHSTSTLYWGTSINYRYTNGAGCSSANPEPGAGALSAWENCWEFASLQDIRYGIASGQTFTDASLGLSGADVHTTLLAWVRAGYAPTNSAYNGTAHDGKTIGAVPFYTAPAPPPVPFGSMWAR